MVVNGLRLPAPSLALSHLLSVCLSWNDVRAPVSSCEVPHLILNFPASRTTRDRFLFFINDTVCSVQL